MEKIRAENQPTLVVDSGDLFFVHKAGMDREKALKKAQVIGRAYRRMVATAMNVGDLDLLQGLDFLQQESSLGLPLISTNLLDPQKKTPLFRPYIVREVSGVRVAFFGLLPSGFLPEIESAIKKVTEGKIFIKNPVEAARETVQNLQGQADLIVLLSDLGLYKDQEVAKEVPGIHFILGGHEGRFLKRPYQVGKTFIFQSSFKGMNVGILRITLENPAFPFQDRGKIPQIQEEIDRLDLRLQSIQRAKERRSQEKTGNIERTLQEINRRKAFLQEELKRAMESLEDRGNRFLFALDPLEVGLPQDEKTLREIAEAGIDRD